MLSKAGTGYRTRRLSRTTFCQEDINAHAFSDDIADPDAVCLQRLHDLCLVRPSEIQGELAAGGGAGELGDCLFRILAGGAGQPLGQRGLFGGAAQDHAGGDHAGGVRRLLGVVPEGAAGLESRARFSLHRYWRVSDFSQMGMSYGRAAGGCGRLDHFAAGATRKTRPFELSVSSHSAPSGPCRTSLIRSCRFSSRRSSAFTALPFSVSRTSIAPRSAPVNRLPSHFGNSFPL